MWSEFYMRVPKVGLSPKSTTKKNWILWYTYSALERFCSLLKLEMKGREFQLLTNVSMGPSHDGLDT